MTAPHRQDEPPATTNEKASPMTSQAHGQDEGLEKVARAIEEQYPGFDNIAKYVRSLGSEYFGEIATPASRDGAELRTAPDALREALIDLQTHREAWHGALLIAQSCDADGDNVSYWKHEIEAFERTFAALSSAPVPSGEVKDD